MKEIVIDEYVNIERPVGYKSNSHLTVEDELRYLFHKEKRLVTKILRYDGYRVLCSKKLRKDTYKKFKELIK